VHPYKYVLESGEVQDRIATVNIEEREWRWKWYIGLPFQKITRRTIDVSFDNEIGEEAGSWKGGCLGCGYEIRGKETYEQCLRRMERERKF
jgi:hypothetical protein